MIWELGFPRDSGFQKESKHRSGQRADIYCHLLGDQQTVSLLKIHTEMRLKDFSLDLKGISIHHCLHVFQNTKQKPNSNNNISPNSKGAELVAVLGK